METDTASVEIFKIDAESATTSSPSESWNTNWQTITRPKPLLEPSDILDSCEQAIGRLNGLILRAEAERPPTIGAEAMHPTVWGAAARL